MQQAGKYIVLIGIIIIILGLIIYILGDKMQWFGNLPGDIKIRKKNFQFYAPVVSMLILSIIITIIVWAINKFR